MSDVFDDIEKKALKKHSEPKKKLKFNIWDTLDMVGEINIPITAGIIFLLMFSLFAVHQCSVHIEISQLKEIPPTEYQQIDKRLINECPSLKDSIKKDMLDDMITASEKDIFNKTCDNISKAKIKKKLK